MKAVLFDLDGTLLDIDLDEFLHAYFRALSPVVVEVIGGDPKSGIGAVMRATDAMVAPHPGRTNEAVFAEAFQAAAGKVLGAQAWARFDRFYAEVFPSLRGNSRPAAGAVEAVEAACQLGLKTVVATNPIYPAAAIRQRLAWAGLAHVPFDLVTSYENMQAAKPELDYYRQMAQMIGCEPADCLMVGDDPVRDLPAARVGMKTFYLGPQPAPAADHVGDLLALPDLLRRLAGKA